jgi:prolyl 4-hydroxylase
VDGRSSLSGKDCFQMGRLAYFKNDYYHTILWVEYAMTQTNNTQELSDMYDYLNFAYYQQGDVAYAAKLAEEWIRIDPTNSRANNNLEHYRLMLQQNKDQAAFVEDQKSEHETKEAARGSSHRPVRRPYTPWTSQQLHHDYEKLCRGEQTEYVNPYQHQLSCAYRRIDPVFTLTPLKEEILHMDPLIRIFHDVLAPSEKKLMKEMAAPRLHRSVVFQSGNDLTETEYRISKTAWIADSEDPGIRQISMKAGTIAGLNLNTVEHLQVLNYGIGGHYEPHYDFSTATDETDFSDNIGNRIATVIFYIEDVEAGGATAFPAVGVRVTPEAGAAGLWYNLHRSGVGDTRTIHGACPVLAGTKWVATKWFHERGQEFVRPCALDPAL